MGIGHEIDRQRRLGDPRVVVDSLPALAFVFSSVFKEPKLSARTGRPV